MWWRIPLGAVINVVTFVAIGTIGFILMRLTWPAYAAVEKAMTFDTSMLATRLAIAATASLIGAYLAGLTTRDARVTPLIGGLILLVLFIPVHIQLWDKFPLWYHATFLTSLPLLAYIGGTFAREV